MLWRRPVSLHLMQKYGNLGKTAPRWAETTAASWNSLTPTHKIDVFGGKRVASLCQRVRSAVERVGFFPIVGSG